MIIKVISLKKSIDRREYIFKQLSKLDLLYSFEDAIELSSWSDELLDAYSKKMFELRYNRSPSLGEIGCSLSHDLARKKFLQMNNQEMLMVLEDDAKFMCTKNELFSAVKVFKKSKFDILILGYSKCDDYYEKHTNIINPIHTIEKIGRISIGPRYLHSTSGAVGYIIKKNSAKIMSNIEPQSILADDWAYFAKLGLKIVHTNPMIVKEDTANLASTLNHINYSLSFKKSENFIFQHLLFYRKHIVGFLRKIILYFRCL